MSVFDIESLTLGEMAMVEEASGKSMGQLVNLSSYRMALVLMVSASRSGEPVPSWQELMSRRVLDASSSISDSQQDSPSPK
jgi:hypothetical protein